MVRSIMIVEIMGKPAAYAREALEAHIKNLDSLKAVEVHSIKISEAKEIEREDKRKDVDPMFTCFAEVDFEVETFGILSEIVFDFMPSSIEVIDPHTFSIDANEVTGLFNNISGRLHRYDDIAKMAHAKIAYLEGMVKQTEKALTEKDSKKTKKKKGKKKAKK